MPVVAVWSNDRGRQLAVGALLDEAVSVPLMVMRNAVPTIYHSFAVFLESWTLAILQPVAPPVSSLSDIVYDKNSESSPGLVITSE